MTTKAGKQDWVEAARSPGAPTPQGARAERLESAGLHQLVFVCGAGLMGLEIVGGRALSPYFGSSVFVWGAIIGVFMAALALGYYLGGLVADRRPSLAWLSAIVALAGMMVLALTQLAVRVSNRVDLMDLGPRWGPLLAAGLLYLPPSLLLGAVSPFAVRLQARAVGSMGNVAGRLYALSTAGSLLGTLATTFWLIPALGTVRIFYMLGALLLAAAALALAARFAARGGPKSPAATALTVFFMGLPLVMAWVFCPARLPGALRPLSSVHLNCSGAELQYQLDEKESPYHTIAVVQGFSPARVLAALEPALRLALRHADAGVDPAAVARFLSRGPDLGRFGLRLPRGVLQSAAALDPAAVLEMRFNDLTESSISPNQPGWPPHTDYTKTLHLGVALCPKASRVLVIGLGGGSVPREFCELYADRGMRVDVVDIDPAVLEVARERFHFRDAADGPYRAYIEDGRQFVRRGRGRFEKYDIIILDAYSGGGQIPPHLVTREFLAQCRARLAPGGVLVSNIISAVDGDRGRLFRAYYKTMASLFENVYVFPHPHRDARWMESARNLILAAPLEGGARLAREDLVEKAEALVAGLKAGGEAFKARAGRAEALRLPERAGGCYVAADVAAMTADPVLTDDYAPVEVMFWLERHGAAAPAGSVAYED